MSTFVQNHSKGIFIAIAATVILAAITDSDFMRTLSLAAVITYPFIMRGEIPVLGKSLTLRDIIIVTVAVVGVGIFSSLHIALILCLALLAAVLVAVETLRQQKATNS